MRRLLLPLLAFALLSGCRVGVDVRIDLAGDGSGTVTVAATLDADAVAELAEVGGSIRTDDLEDAGWTVADPVERDDGSVVVVLERDFSTPREAEQIVASIAPTGGGSGDDAPIMQIEIEHDPSFASTSSHVTGVVDLRRGVEAFGDPALTEALGGQPLGADVEALEAQLGERFAELFDLSVAVRLPGGAKSVDEQPFDQLSAGPVEVGTSLRWTPRLGQRLELAASARQWNVANLVLLGVSSSAAAAATIVAVRARRRPDNAIESPAADPEDS